MKIASLLFIAFMAVAAGASSLTVRIAAEPDALLPGVVPSLRVWITNEGPSPSEVPTRTALQVIPPKGEPFIAYSAMRGDHRTMDLAAPKPLILAPGETRDLSFWSGDSWFLADARFRTVGRFRLQLVADPRLDSDKLSGLSRILDQSGLVQPLVSNEATYSVLEPTGPDLAVWSVMEARGGTCTAEVTELIWRDYPMSRYAAYCIRDINDPDELKRIAGYEASLAKSPHPYWADGCRLGIAQFWMSRGSGLIARDVDAAFDAYHRARSLLESLAQNAVSPEHRRDAERLLESVRSRKDIADLHNALHGDDDIALRSYVSCYEYLTGGRNKVWFGYNNPNSKRVDIPIGNDNKFTPPPFDRKQPTSFKPGTVDFAFSIETKEPALVWHLQGEVVQFKLPDSRQCPNGFDPNVPSTWQVEE